MKIGAFIVHLERARERRSHVEAMKSLLPMPCQIVDAVDGALLSDVEKAAVYVRDLCRPHYPFSLSASEIGCFLSHRRAWQTLLDSDFGAGLVMEDDADLDMDKLSPGLVLALAAMGGGTLVRFPNRIHGDRGPVISRSDKTTLVAPRRIGLGMVALMLDRPAARTLLDLTEQFDRPVDTFVQMPWHHGVSVRAIRPSGVTEVSDRLGGTTIHKDIPSLAAKLAREAARARYRFGLRALKARHGPTR